jgi:hypothetical protein
MRREREIGKAYGKVQSTKSLVGRNKMVKGRRRELIPR